MLPKINFPGLESSRLAIDRLTTSDADEFFAYRSLPEVARFQDWAPESIGGAEEFISGATAIPFNQSGTWFQLALRDNTTGSMVGDVGLHFLEGDVHQVEIGITVAPSRQNQGLASEALDTLLDYLFVELKKHRVVAAIDPGNLASERLLEKVGFRKEGHFKESLSIDGEWVDDVRFGLLRSEWPLIRKSCEQGKTSSS